MLDSSVFSLLLTTCFYLCCAGRGGHTESLLLFIIENLLHAQKLLDLDLGPGLGLVNWDSNRTWNYGLSKSLEEYPCIFKSAAIMFLMFVFGLNFRRTRESSS